MTFCLVKELVARIEFAKLDQSLQNQGEWIALFLSWAIIIVLIYPFLLSIYFNSSSKILYAFFRTLFPVPSVY
jgi:hypothetical protein